MGLFDGAAGQGDWASTAHIARLLHLPIVLVIDCAHLSNSVAAIAHGYRSFDPRLHLAGVILNRVGSDRHLQFLQEALAPLALPILGVLRRQAAITIPDRHLGLVPTDELPEFSQLIERLAKMGTDCFDWQQLRPLLATPRSSSTFTSLSSPLETKTSAVPPIRIAIARDRAFNFYYADNLDLLTALGAELIPWSPLTDTDLPPKIQGLYLGGGFPELFAATLSANHPARSAVQRAIAAGMPTYAECGGLMYLCAGIIDFQEQEFPMVGCLPSRAVMQQRLILGYRQATALQDSPLLTAGTCIWGHEFHHSSLHPQPTAPLYHLRGHERNSPTWEEGWRLEHLHASYVHLHWGGQPELPMRFVQHCRRYRRPSDQQP